MGEFLLSLAIQFLPTLFRFLWVIIIKWRNGLGVGWLGLRIAILLWEIQKAQDQDESDALIPSLSLEGRIVRRLDVTNTHVEERLNLSHAQIGQVSGYMLCCKELKATGLVAASIDLSEATIEILDLRGCSASILDLSRARIGQLFLNEKSNILVLDMSETTVQVAYGLDKANAYLRDTWRSRVYKKL